MIPRSLLLSGSCAREVMTIINFKPNTQIRICEPVTEYVKGKNPIKTVVPITYTLGDDTNELFYCEWRGSFGADLLTADSMNIKDLATVRMPYNPDVFEALRSKQVIIYQAGIDDPYEVVGSPDNYLMQNRMIEFKVKQTEGK